MVNIRIRKERLINHFRYDWWKYAVSLLAIMVFWNLFNTMTRPRVAAELKVDTYLVGNLLDETRLKQTGEQALKDFPDQKEINFKSFPMTGLQDSTAWQKLVVFFGAREGDLYIMDHDIFMEFAKQGGFTALDPYINDKKINIDDKIPLDKVKLKAQEDQEEFIYGLPVDSLTGFSEATGYEVKDRVIVLTRFSENTHHAVKMIDWLFAHESR